MTFVHDDYLKYEIPSDWCAEENEDTLLIYDPDGEGAIVTSFFSLMDADVLLEERICIMAKEFIDNNLIKLKEPLILMNSSCGKVILRGTGRTSDVWFFLSETFPTRIARRKPLRNCPCAPTVIRNSSTVCLLKIILS